jgi:hypothetical protein
LLRDTAAGRVRVPRSAGRRQPPRLRCPAPPPERQRPSGHSTVRVAREPRFPHRGSPTALDASRSPRCRWAGHDGAVAVEANARLHAGRARRNTAITDSRRGISGLGDHSIEVITVGIRQPSGIDRGQLPAAFSATGCRSRKRAARLRCSAHRAPFETASGWKRCPRTVRLARIERRQRSAGVSASASRACVV